LLSAAGGACAATNKLAIINAANATVRLMLPPSNARKA
jgi:hypothetical protein